MRATVSYEVRHRQHNGSIEALCDSTLALRENVPAREKACSGTPRETKAVGPRNSPRPDVQRKTGCVLDLIAFPLVYVSWATKATAAQTSARGFRVK